MPHKAPIVLIENDADDLEFLSGILKEITSSHPARIFTSAEDALEYLRTTDEQPFVILSDISLKKMSGLELRRTINEDAYLKKKAVPFIFLTDYATEPIVREAYDLTVQGFYKKAHSLEEQKQQLTLIVTYWSSCLHPNSHFFA